MPSLDLLYLVASVCILTITGFFIALAIQMLRVLGSVDRISRNVEQISYLIDRIAEVIFPGMERVAKRADKAEQKMADFFERKFNSYTKRNKE